MISQIWICRSNWLKVPTTYFESIFPWLNISKFLNSAFHLVRSKENLTLVTIVLGWVIFCLFSCYNFELLPLWTERIYANAIKTLLFFNIQITSLCTESIFIYLFTRINLYKFPDRCTEHYFCYQQTNY